MDSLLRISFTVLIMFQLVAHAAQAERIHPGLGGAWVDPGHAGQGLVIEVVPTDRELIAYWFTWAEDGSRLWRVGQGGFDGNQAVLDFVVADGGRYLADTPVTLRSVGTGTVVFDSCQAAQMTYTEDEGDSRTLELARLTPDISCHIGEREGPSEYVVDEAGRAVALNGLWQASGCIRLGTHRSLSQETMVFDGDSLEIRMSQHASIDCSGPIELITVSLLIQAAGRSTASLDGRNVPVTRYDVVDVNSGELARQVFYLELLDDRMRLTHGVFGDEGGRLDEDGYPLDLFTVFLERAR